MKWFYEHYKDASPKLRHSVALLPWKRDLLILGKTNSIDEAGFFANKVIELGWTRVILLNYMKADASPPFPDTRGEFYLAFPDLTRIPQTVFADID